MSKEVNIGNISRRFDANISALRVFNNQIGRLAEEHDKTTVEQYNNTFAELVGIPVEELDLLKDITKDDFTFALSAQTEDENFEVYEKLQIDSQQISVLQKFKELNSKEFLLKSANFLRASTKKLPIQATILRRSALITLASHFEYLIAELLHSFYHLYPQALPSEERVLSLADLRTMGSIEDAENQLIEKEIDSLLRDTIEKQLDYFSSKRIRVDLDQLGEYKNWLIEIFQRRNLIVHNDGIVNKIYLSRVSEELLDSEIENGTRLDVTEDYLNKAIETIHISGIILTQLCWRKWQKDSIDPAESIYIDLLYESLQEHKYSFTKQLQNFSLKLEYTSDRIRRVAIVNHAIALRELNQQEELNKLLDTLDWSSCALEFRAAIFALKGDEENLLRILPKAIAANEIQRFHLEEWPLFEPFRESENFRKQIQESANENIILRKDSA
jgi:hypothetical protein